jgi:hypothetical protein
MASMMRHQAGSDRFLQYRLNLNLIKAGLGELRSDLLSRFIEFWCQKNCNGDWRIEETSRSITVWFDLSRDFVLFKISDEYDYFTEHTPVTFDHLVSDFTSQVDCLTG